MKTEKIPPVHPGEILRQDYLEPLGLSANQLALQMRVTPNRITAILRGERTITAETALRLARAVGTSPDFWLNLQTEYDLRLAEDRLGARIQREVHPIQPAT